MQPSATPFTGDEHLEVIPRPSATPALTREQAEVVMLNSWPPPPLRDNVLPEPRTAGTVTFTLASVRLSEDVADRRRAGAGGGEL